MCQQRQSYYLDSPAHLSERIRAHAESLPFEDQQVVYLFFACDLTVSDISYTCQSPVAKVLLVVIDFLSWLYYAFKTSTGLCISYCPLDWEAGVAFLSCGRSDHTNIACTLQVLSEMRDIRMSTGTRLVNLIGTALDRGPLHPMPQLRDIKTHKICHGPNHKGNNKFRTASLTTQ